MVSHSQNGAYSGSSSLVLWEDSERVFHRGWRRDVNGQRRAVLIVQCAVEHPSRSSLDRLTHEYELKDELDGAWAVRPLDLVRDAGRTMLVLEDTRLYRDLADREGKIQRLVDANILGILIWNLEGAIVEANEAFLHMLQYGREDVVLGRLRWTDLTPAEWREQDERAVAELRSTGIFQLVEKEYFRKNGSRIPVLIGGALFEESRNEGVAFVLDLSERKRAEEEHERLRQLESDLAHVNRLSIVGELATSLAHEVLHPIATARNNARAGMRFLEMSPPNLDEAGEALGCVVRDADRAKDIVGRMRDHVKKKRLREGSLLISMSD
jgi:PAS domain S-box-containing protein